MSSSFFSIGHLLENLNTSKLNCIRRNIKTRNSYNGNGWMLTRDKIRRYAGAVQFVFARSDPWLRVASFLLRYARCSDYYGAIAS